MRRRKSTRYFSRFEKYLVLSVVWLWMVPRAAAETIAADSTVSAVTVFPDRAAVTRTAVVKLPAGSHAVAFGPLPAQVEPESVTAKGAGEAAVMLYGVRLVTEQLETAQDPRAKELEEDIRKLQRRQQQAQNTRQVLEQERTYLSSIQAASSEQIGKDLITTSPSAADTAALLAFLDGAFLKNFERDQDAAVELEEFARLLGKLQRELAELTQGRYTHQTKILVDLEAQDGGTLRLEVSYRLPGATWQPSYEARATTASNEVILALSGLVRQQTGEDWDDVRVTLSTAKPSIAGSMPELQPWFLRPWEPVNALRAHRGLMMEQPASVPESSVVDRIDESRVGRGGGADLEAQLAQATVASQGPAVTFTLPRPESIPADWQPHKVPIGSTSFAAQLAYETTPRLLPHAFLRAKIVNATSTLYLPGPVSVFLDGAFVSTASMKQVAPNEEFDLYLGVDERVKIERRPLKERVEVSLLPGLRGKTKSTEYEFLTTVENFTGRRIGITAFDQVPVSEREEIVVESVKTAPGGVEKDPEKPGVFRWVFELAPDQKQELRLSYRVRHPVEMQIQ